MRKLVFASLALVAVIGAVGVFAGNRLYQEHISSSLKQTLKAAVGYDVTQAEDRQYLLMARTQVHTQRDQVEVDKLSSLLNLRDDVIALHQDVWGQGSDPVDCHVKGLEQGCKEAFDKWKQFQSESKLVENGLEEIRSDLGLPKEVSDNNMHTPLAEEWAWAMN